ncbi:MAG: orotidine-5'-phosphate decarboxylase [Parcubacteria group bacterium Gr01-1014_8]|nr:MAG: orotidine-5'-phosphate decarboxylase [Parcubacteria group bacterium Gr01-1014_8]
MAEVAWQNIRSPVTIPTMERHFGNLLEAQWDKGHFLCVGLDPDIEKIPTTEKKASIRETIASFNRAIVDATKDIVCAYKPNQAFYEAQGTEGWEALKDTVSYIREVASNVPIILDAKRGDIGNTNNGYERMAFDFFGVDAITVHAYQGCEALEPFFARKDKGVFILARTSNPGAGEFQDLEVEGEPLYKIIARAAVRWNTNANVGVVVGTTYPKELALVRAVVGEMPILMPGTGAQGGDLEASVRLGKNKVGKGIIINASRAILYVSKNADFARLARSKAEELHSAIQKAL